MNGGPSGFNNAPVSKTCFICCGLFSVLFGIQGRSKKLDLSYMDIFGHLRLWKLISSVFTFSSTPELMFGLYLLYYFRVFERQIGSNKYSAFVVLSLAMSLLLEILALAYLKDPTTNMVTSGPYGLIFALFVPFFFDIPISKRFRVCGVRFSDKTFIYLAGVQLLFSSWKKSILPGVCGILVGFLYRMNVLHIRKAKFPEFVTSLFSRLSWPSTGSRPEAPPNQGNPPSFASRPTQRQFPDASVVPTVGTQQPSDESIATLVSMGFDRNHARQALLQARNDMNVATNILLEAQAQ